MELASDCGALTLRYTVRCQKLRFSRFKACFADYRDSTKRTNIEWGNVRSFHLPPLWGFAVARINVSIHIQDFYEISIAFVVHSLDHSLSARFDPTK